jgi:predicted short-subunit dehydrogenase-like oxidoreductase (DUF2520 family)
VKTLLPDIAIYGTGNLAWQLGEALHNRGYPISSVWGRNRSDKQALARRLNARALENVADGGHPAIKLLLVSDAAIAALAHEIPADDASLVVHCAGAGELDWLLPHSRRAIFWPLQTIRKEAALDWSNVPILVDAQRADDLTLLLDMGQLLSQQVKHANAKERTLYHAAAVISGNFGNYLLDQAFGLLHQNGLDHRLLLPILEHQLRLFASNQRPLLRQTGPAKRGDWQTMQKHLELLVNEPAHAATYRLLSELIVKASTQG